MIASVAFRNFKALRHTQLALGRFNLLIGPNGSGKTSLIQAILRLRLLSKLPLNSPEPEGARLATCPEVTFHFERPHDGLEVVLSGVTDPRCDRLQVVPRPTGEGADDWPGLRSWLLKARGYILDHHAMELPAMAKDGAELSLNGGNLAAVLATRRERAPEAFAGMTAEFVRILPEFAAIETEVNGDGRIRLALPLVGGGKVAAEDVSQGTLYLLALLLVAFDPSPPSVACIEELDRGIHPRLLREVRDILYRLSHPESFGLDRPPVQVIATTHSPYLLDLFREHPEEVVIAAKQGCAATFSRLTDQKDLAGLLAEGALGDMWYAGIIGGVPACE